MSERAAGNCPFCGSETDEGHSTMCGLHPSVFTPSQPADQTRDELVRYTLVDDGLEVHPDGPWVRYEQAADALAAGEREIAKLREALEEMLDDYTGFISGPMDGGHAIIERARAALRQGDE